MTAAVIECADTQRLLFLGRLRHTVETLTAVALLMAYADKAVDEQLRLLDQTATWMALRLQRNEAA